MKKRLTKKEFENFPDITFAIYILEQEISRCGILLSYKRNKLKKTIETLQKIKIELDKNNSNLSKINGLLNK